MPRQLGSQLVMLLFLIRAAGVLAGELTNEPFPVLISINAASTRGEWKPIWRFFGADEPNYAYMKDGKKLLGELGQLGSPQIFFRAHHLLTSGDGAFALKFGSTSAYKEDRNGNPIYDWTINDKIFDTYLANHVKPYVQIGFMPEALSAHPQNYPHHPPANKLAPVDGGQSYPPKDYAKWGELAHQWASHCLQRYGLHEVEQWYWEVWNEPNISYWHGSRDDYFKLYDFAADGVRRALPRAKVGGPETAGGPGVDFLGEFLAHCAEGTNYVTGKIGSPLDFISFHAKGSPIFTNGHVRMGMANQLRNMNDAFAVIAQSQFKSLPVIIGESDPEGCAACRQPRDAYRNGTMYSSYTAAIFPRALELAGRHGVNLEGALTWAFEFENQPPFAGFRQLASAGMDLPVLNVLRMFGKMGGRELAVASSMGLDAETIRQAGVRGQPDISAWASRGQHQIATLVWHYHDDDLPGPDALVDVRWTGIPAANQPARLTHFRIDATHSNSYGAWKRMGSPLPLTPEQHAQLETAGQLQMLAPPQTVQINDGSAVCKFSLPRQGVSLLILRWK